MSTHPHHNVPCPDCSQPMFSVDGGMHDDTCPHMAAIEEVCAKDRVWFEEHPDAGHYYRQITPPECVELLAIQTGQTEAPPDGRWVGRVKVYLIDEGLRGRSFEDVYLLVPI
jgi:hypothetical protein